MTGAWARTTGDSAWAQYQRAARAESTTLVLEGGPIIDPSQVAPYPQDCLLDTVEHEAEATALWQIRRRSNRHWSEGEIRLRYQRARLLPFGAVDDVVALWWYLIQLSEAFLATGRGETGYPDQDLPVVLETVKRRVFFSGVGQRVMVEPVSFLASLLDEAQRFFAGAERHLAEAPADRQVGQLGEMLRER